MKDFIMPAYSNLALCHLKLGNYDSVLVYANQTLIQDNSNIKAFYRRGMAYKGLKQVNLLIKIVWISDMWFYLFKETIP